MTESYCLSKKLHVSHHIVFVTVCAQNVCSSTNASASVLTHYCMTYFTIYRQSRCPIYGTLCSNGLS